MQGRAAGGAEQGQWRPGPRRRGTGGPRAARSMAAVAVQRRAASAGRGGDGERGSGHGLHGRKETVG